MRMRSLLRKNTMSSTSTILDGPSKFDLMLSLFDGNSTKPRYARFFILEPGARESSNSIPVLISGIIREDGSGEKWIFTGYIQGKSVTGYFCTQDRRGWIRYVDGQTS
jgi:hypothetical protein